MGPLQRLRQSLRDIGLTGYIVPSTDEYQNEYTPEHNKRLEFLTGFTGSNGLCVVLPDIVLFFTDGRYIAQATQQLSDKEYKIFLLAELIGFPWAQYIDLKHDIIGYNPELSTVAQLHRFAGLLSLPILLPTNDLIDKIWDNRPAKSEFTNYVYYSAGESEESKIQRIRQSLKQQDINHYLITDSSAISWLINIRAKAIPYCYMLPSRAIISDQGIQVFTDLSLVTTPLLQDIVDGSVQFFDHEQWIPSIQELRGKVLIDSATCSVLTQESLQECQIISQNIDLISICKAIKNDIELADFKTGHIHDAIILCEFFAWLQRSVGTKPFTEYDLTREITEYRYRFRDGNHAYMGESFPAICGYLENSAIIHYRPLPDQAKTIEPHGLLLIDTGAHYLGCTTDITRVIALGTSTAEQRLRYTEVLKGHIDLAIAKFPIGTTGGQLDVLARRYLWNQGLNYPHGTGHGVGNMLSVHEGPAAIRGDNCVPLEVGMILSNEPGYYVPGEYGLRIENLMAVKHADQQGFLAFENLTLVPYCHDLIDYSLLNADHLDYLVSYYQQIRALVYPHLSPDAQSWVNKQIHMILDSLSTCGYDIT